MNQKNLLSEMIALKNPHRAAISARFFKTGVGEYGAGDVFLGIPVPQTRTLVKKYASQMTLGDVDMLLQNNYHEVRLAGVLLLVYFAQKKIYPGDIVAKFYMDHAERINNWDLIDVSSEHIIGPYIEEYLTSSEREYFIKNCIASSNIWVNRIIMLASFYQIKQGDPKLTLSLAKKMVGHKHDLIHKATGWMLREVGKRCSLDILRSFLNTYAQKMPRTMLRYAIEKMPPDERRHYMNVR